MRSAGIGVVVILVAFAPVGARQGGSPADTKPALTGAQDLGAGWNALGAGRPAEAEAIAERLLQAGSRRHEALSLKIFARARAGRPEAALDDYEQWMKVAPHEDVFLLQPVAQGILEAQAHAADISVRVDALQALAEAGDKTAPARLGTIAASGESPGVADVALARMSEPEAIARLTRRITAPSARTDVSGAIDALVKAKPAGAATTIAAALDPSRPMPTRMAAARALGQLGRVGAIPQLKRALQDVDPPVRMAAAASLARLGDQSGAAVLGEMENSPVTEIRLMAAQASAAASPTGPWVSTATGSLDDPDPLTRLTAAQLLLAHGTDPAAALATLNKALADPNPAVRLAAARAADQIPGDTLATDVATLRRLLRDADARVRITAAGALLKLAGGVE